MPALGGPFRTTSHSSGLKSDLPVIWISSPCAVQAWNSGQIADRLLIDGDLLGYRLVHGGVDDPEALHDQARAGVEPRKLVVGAQGCDLLFRAPDQDEAREIATVRGEEGHLEALDGAGLLL